MAANGLDISRQQVGNVMFVGGELTNFVPIDSPVAETGIAENLYYRRSKECPAAGKKRLSSDTALQASTGEVKDLRGETRDQKEVVADLTLKIKE